MEFVREHLWAGPMPAKELDVDASAVGVSTPTLKRAKSKLGVKAEQQRAGGRVTGWIVSLGQSPEALNTLVDPLDTVDTLDVRGQEHGFEGDQGLLGESVDGNGQPAANQGVRP